MSFRQKIDIILKANKLGVDTIHALEEKVGAGVGSIGKFYRNDKFPGLGTVKKIQEKMGVNLQWWETGQGDVFVEDENKLKVEEPRAEYLRLIETQEKLIKSYEREIEDLRRELKQLKGKVNSP